MLHLANLRKRYGDVVALDGVELAAQPGRILGFLGANGAGKTTTMRSVFGLVDLDAGTVRWHDRPVTAATRMSFGYMPEQRGLYRNMKVAAQLRWLGELHGMERGAAAAATDRWLALLGLADRADEELQGLSHGNQQRVQLAAALVHDPQLLVLDEPFSGLDPLGVSAMTDVLQQRATDGAAVVFSSHQLDLVEDLVDDVVIIANGRNVLTGTLGDVRSSTGTTNVSFRLEGPTVSVVTLDGVQHAVRTGRDGLSRVGVPVGTAPDKVLAAIQRHGTVDRFTFEPPSLTTVFRDVVGMSVTELEAANTTHQEVSA